MLETSLSFLEQLRQDNAPEQWDRLVQLYTPVLRSWLGRYQDISPSDADDLVQDVLLTLSQELPRFEHNRKPGAFRSWLRRILVHRLQNFWRERQNQPRAVGGSDFLKQMEQLQDDDSGLSQWWDREHDLHVVRHLLALVRARVEPQTWHAFWAQVMEGMPAEEVAGRLGLSVNSTYVAKSRILQALRKTAEGLIQ